MSLVDDAPTTTAAATAETFESRTPGTGELVGTFPVHGAQEVQAAVGRARAASAW